MLFISVLVLFLFLLFLLQQTILRLPPLTTHPPTDPPIPKRLYSAVTRLCSAAGRCAWRSRWPAPDSPPTPRLRAGTPFRCSRSGCAPRSSRVSPLRLSRASTRSQSSWMRLCVPVAATRDDAALVRLTRRLVAAARNDDGTLGRVMAKVVLADR